MSTTIAPAPARSDDTTTGTPVSTRTVRRTGVAVAAAAALWSATFIAFDPQTTDPAGMTLVDLGQLPAQLALFGLVTLQLRTSATGVGRFARGMLKAEFGLLGLATLWTVLHAFVPAIRDDLWMMILDAFWPLSMLGMFVIGVKIAFAGRWRGPVRFWPLVAESWAVVSVPAMIILGSTGGRYVGSIHLLAGYATLGVLLALRPHLTGARD